MSTFGFCVTIWRYTSCFSVAIKRFTILDVNIISFPSVFSSTIVRGMLKKCIIIDKNGERFVLMATWLSTARYIGYDYLPPCEMRSPALHWRNTFAWSLVSLRLRAGERNGRHNYTNKNMITRTYSGIKLRRARGIEQTWLW